MSDIRRLAQRHNTHSYQLPEDLETEGTEDLLEGAPTDNWRPIGDVARRLVDKLDPRRAT